MRIKLQFPRLCKTFCVYSYHACFILWHKSENVLQKEMKDWTFKVYLLTGEISSWFLLIESLKMTFDRSMCDSWICCQTEKLRIVLCDLKSCPYSVKQPEPAQSNKDWSILTCIKLEKWLWIVKCSKFAKWPNCLKSGKWPVWKSIYLHPSRS